MDFSNKSIEEIDEILVELGREKESIREQMRAATAARDAKTVQEGWAARVGNMNEAEREALKKMLNVQVADVQGIESSFASTETTNDIQEN